MRRWALVIGATMLLLILAAVVLTPVFLYAAVMHAARQDQTAPADAIVVLGAAQWDGQPTPDLQARLDHAADLYRAGKAPLIVLTGGAAPGDRYSESEAGQMYLRGRGIPAGAMELVGGRSTIESLRETQQLLAKDGKTRTLMVSDPFHMFRVDQMARDLGLQPLSSPTQTSPIRPGSATEQRYVVREVFAYLAYLFLQR
ncbi:MAG TPA: YdcF family protein [Thermomicrobiaceae bacterium]|nr:YdcF family protein [Thermomicrobiaceae bacterium]